MLNGDVVLLSDGGEADGDVGAAVAAGARDGLVLHTVFVPPAAAYLSVVPQTHRDGLDALAAASGGFAGSLRDVDRLIARLGERREIRLGQGDYAALAWQDLGLFFVFAAAFPLLAMFRREAA